MYFWENLLCLCSFQVFNQKLYYYLLTVSSHSSCMLPGQHQAKHKVSNWLVNSGAVKILSKKLVEANIELKVEWIKLIKWALSGHKHDCKWMLMLRQVYWILQIDDCCDMLAITTLFGDNVFKVCSTAPWWPKNQLAQLCSRTTSRSVILDILWLISSCT